jgi:hypothetical protein
VPGRDLLGRTGMARSLDFIGGECPVEYQSCRTVPIGDFYINRKNSAWSFSDRTEKVKFESGEKRLAFQCETRNASAARRHAPSQHGRTRRPTKQLARNAKNLGQPLVLQHGLQKASEEDRGRTFRCFRFPNDFDELESSRRLRKT